MFSHNCFQTLIKIFHPSIQQCAISVKSNKKFLFKLLFTTKRTTCTLCASRTQIPLFLPPVDLHLLMLATED